MPTLFAGRATALFARDTTRSRHLFTARKLLRDTVVDEPIVRRDRDFSGFNESREQRLSLDVATPEQAHQHAGRVRHRAANVVHRVAEPQVGSLLLKGQVHRPDVPGAEVHLVELALHAFSPSKGATGRHTGR